MNRAPYLSSSASYAFRRKAADRLWHVKRFVPVARAPRKRAHGEPEIKPWHALLCCDDDDDEAEPIGLVVTE